MQKIIKKNDGVTMVILIVTIIVLLIIVGISINYGVSTLYSVGDERTETELSLVQQAVIQQYTLLITEKEDGKIATEISTNLELKSDVSRPTILIGDRIADTATLNEYGFSQYSNNYSTTPNMAYEEYYYYLDEADLVALGIEKNNKTGEETRNREYIVNYSTGEVYDIINKSYYTSDDPIYLEGTNSKINETTYNFTDE